MLMHYTAINPDSYQSYSTNIRLEDLPFEGCMHCHRALKRWHEFNTDIVDVISLSQLFEGMQVSAVDHDKSDEGMDRNV